MLITVNAEAVGDLAVLSLADFIRGLERTANEWSEAGKPKCRQIVQDPYCSRSLTARSPLDRIVAHYFF